GVAATRQRLVHPGRTVEQRMLRIDELGERLAGGMASRIDHARTALRHRMDLLARCNPAAGLPAARERVARAALQLHAAATQSRRQRDARVTALARALNAVSPLATLERGFAIVARPDGSRWGKPLGTAQDVQRGDAIVAHLAHGSIDATVDRAASRPEQTPIAGEKE
ncbi:MAG: hypothetical protein F4Z28_04665, partial [Gammaproteobacteria bacterium]|nr:hypothetical protein [Gammaproteobacteria bacterium]